jgi:predicted  nucleic acid-binding Zn-ribbon protein
MGGLLSELLRAGQWLRGGLSLAQKSDPDLSNELAEYRHNVERLRDLLPSIQRGLLAEKASLEQKRARMEAAARWAQTSRETLVRR